MSMLRKVAAVATAGLLAIGLAACSCSDAGYKRVHPPASQFQSQLAQSSGGAPMAPDVLSRFRTAASLKKAGMTCRGG